MTVSGSLIGIENPIDSPINYLKQSNGIDKLTTTSKPSVNGYKNGLTNGHSLVSIARDCNQLTCGKVCVIIISYIGEWVFWKTC